jgi:predicted aldo/keto reductase-like oxidoreductase
MQHILYKTGKRSLQIRIRAWNWIRDSMVANGYKDYATLEYSKLQQKVTNLKQNAKRENDKKAQNKPCNEKTVILD